MDRAIEIMQIPVDIDMPNFFKLVGTQQSIMTSVFSTTARVDDTNLRRAQTDRLDNLLRRLKSEEGGEEELEEAPPQGTSDQHEGYSGKNDHEVTEEDVMS